MLFDNNLLAGSFIFSKTKYHGTLKYSKDCFNKINNPETK